MSTHTQPQQPASSALPGIVLAATAVVAARAALIALKDEHFAAGLVRLGVRSTARHLIEGYAMSLVPVVLLAAAFRHATSRRAPLFLLAVIASLVSSYLFVSFRLPPSTYYAPAFDGTRAWSAHAGALVVAAVATALLAVRHPTPAARKLALLVIVAMPLGTVAARLQGPGADDGRPNVVLISIDTLRADRLGCYGYELDTSPEIDHFAEDALVFTRAYSPESWTLPAHMTMLTSLYPSSHGVEEERALPRGVPTLATTLSDAGYATFGIVDTAYWINPEFGFARGFDSYRILPDDAALKIDAILSLVDDLDRRPFFLFAHLYDVHSDKLDLPYEADPEDIEAFAGWYEGDFTGCNERGECASELLFAMVGRKETMPEADARYISSLYDAGIRTLDRKLRHLFDGFEQRGLLDDSVVLITADHGEEFFEHGRPVHTQYFDECVRVPFILRPPGGRAAYPEADERSGELVSLVDVAPTLLSFCDLEPELTQGVSLAPFLHGRALDPPRERILIDGRQPLLGMRSDRWAFVPTKQRLAAFDVRADGAQEVDLLASDARPPELDELVSELEAEAQRLRALAEQFGPGESKKASGGEAQQLRALGYGGGD